LYSFRLFGYYLDRYRKTHWNYKGEVDKWGDKYSLIPIVLLPVLTYVLLCIPKLIRKENRTDGRKYYQLKFILVLFMSTLAFIILHISVNQSTSSPIWFSLQLVSYWYGKLFQSNPTQLFYWNQNTLDFGVKKFGN
jgi:hypothetical protein